MEMLSVYHRDGDKLLMTHYCAAGNQPKFQAKIDEKTGDLLFEFVGGSNLNAQQDPHIHGGRIHFTDANSMESEWDFHVGGEKKACHKFTLRRVQK